MARRQAATAGGPRALGVSPNALMALLFVAGIACCVAMAMPQVHIVAYCGDLGYGPARGAEMLSMMLGFGIFSRIAGGFIADRIGGVATLLISSVLQGFALFLYLFFDGLVSLYVISALFGLFQGGIVPMYAIIVREVFLAAGGRHPARHRPDGDAVRHGAGRLDVGRDLRPDRLLSGRIPQRPGLEPGQCVDRVLAGAGAYPQIGRCVSHRHCDRQTVVGRELHRWPELRGRRMGGFRGKLSYAARSTRVSISLRRAPKSIGLVSSASAPLSSALRLVSASP